MLENGDFLPKMPQEQRERYIYYYLLCYFGIMHFLAIFQMLSGRHFRIFLIVDTVALYSLSLSLVYIAGYLKAHAGRPARLDLIVLVYLSLSLFSVILYFQKDNPASPISYLYGIHYLVFPIFLFFSVKQLGWPFQKRLLKNLCYLHLFLFLVGLLMYYWQPGFYTTFLRNNIMPQDQYYEEWQLYGRLQSYLGSTSIGLLSGVTAILLNIFDFSSVKKTIMIFCCFFGGILSQQKGGYIAVFIGALYFVFIVKTRIFLKLASITAVVLLILFLLNVYHNRNLAVGNRINLISYTKDRIVNDVIKGNPFQERLKGYQDGWKNFLYFPLGLGLGATTSAADASRANPGGQVVDANFMRILSDLGLLGLSLFILINVLAFLNALKKMHRYAFIAVLAIYGLIALGTNVFDHYYLSHFYWLLLGIMTSKRG